MKPITSWDTLLEVAHPLAVEKGWWDDMDRPIDEQVACFHSEISEAFEEFRSRRMDTWYSYSGKQVEPVDHAGKNAEDGVRYGYVDGYLMPLKPEGFWVEIADLLVRLADTCGRYGDKPRGADAVSGAPRLVCPTIAAFICRLHRCADELDGLSQEHESYAFKDASWVATYVVAYCQEQAAAFGVDLWPIVNEKVAYNRTRPHRHGGKVA